MAQQQQSSVAPPVAAASPAHSSSMPRPLDQGQGGDSQQHPTPQHYAASSIATNGHATQAPHSPQHPPPPPPFQHPPQRSAQDTASRHSGYSHDTSNGTNGAATGQKILYSLQPHPTPDARTSKREIKRRTKTGCLTCRRRRIKCDEGQPSCGNCRKSKRECLGYDPIFKASSVHNPLAPGLHTYPPSLPPPMHQLQHATRPSEGPPPQTYHLPLPHVLEPQSRTPPPLHAPPPQNHHGIPYDSPLDPVLNHHTHTHTPPSSVHTPASHASHASHLSGSREARIPGLRSYRKRKNIRMDDLHMADGVSASTVLSRSMSTAPPSESDMSEIMSAWRSQYSGMLDSFFETQWYSQTGDSWLAHSGETLSFFADCNRLFKSRPSAGSVQAIGIPSVEARLMWLLAELPRAAWAARKAADAQLADLLHRLDVVDALLTGAILPPNLVPPAPAPSKSSTPSAEFLSHNFWHHLGNFCAADDTLPPPSQTPAAYPHHQQNPHHHHLVEQQQQQLTSSMLAMRQILSVLENRDVLYSIAVARHFGGRLERLDLERLPAGPDPIDTEHPFAKLSVALRFLADEEVGGTTAVVRGIAGMARRGVLRGHIDEPDHSAN